MAEKYQKCVDPSGKVEILAPAGSLPAFFAAIAAGADAVYCGLKSFSARSKAKNFAISEIAAMASFAHLHNVKIYLALNTLIKEIELKQLIETLGQLKYAEIDGVIVQDLAVWRLVKSSFPDISLHASTQMTVHNAAGVSVLAGMGFRRVVLARELSLEEIHSISVNTDIELEHFVHGALCFSISGQCNFSSFLSGNSGNRGCCNQPCRRRYSNSKTDGYYFSTSDLCSLEYLPQLIDAGVTSCKIEGRMKSAEYVGRVVSAYRMVLDSPFGDRHQAMELARHHLELSFGRRSTAGFLVGNQPTAILSPTRKGTIGQFLGVVSTVVGRSIFIKLGGKLHIGDRLKIMPGNDHSGVGVTVIEMQVNHKKVNSAGSGSVVGVKTKISQKVSPGDTVYKVAAGQIFSDSEERCRKKLQSVKSKNPLLDLSIVISEQRLTIKGDVSGVDFYRIYSPETFPAKDRPLDEIILYRIFAKTDNHPVTLNKLDVNNRSELFIPVSHLNDIRRDFYLKLAAEIAKKRELEASDQRHKILAELSPEKKCRPAPRRSLTVFISSIEDVTVLADHLVDRVVVPVSPENVQGLGNLEKIHGCRKEIIWKIPTIIYPGDWLNNGALLNRLIDHGFKAFIVNNISHFAYFEKLSVAPKLISGCQLYTLNTEAIKSLVGLGVTEITMPVESDRHDLDAILARQESIEISLTVFAPVHLMTSRIGLGEIGANTKFISNKGDNFKLETDNGQTILIGANEFSLLGHLAETPIAHCCNYNIDLSHCGPFSVRGRAVLDAFAGDLVLPNTTTFNFYRGL